MINDVIESTNRNGPRLGVNHSGTVLLNSAAFNGNGVWTVNEDKAAYGWSDLSGDTYAKETAGFTSGA